MMAARRESTRKQSTEPREETPPGMTAAKASTAPGEAAGEAAKASTAPGEAAGEAANASAAPGEAAGSAPKEGPAPRTRSRRQSRPGAGEAALSAQGGPSLPSPRQIDETLRDILRQATPDAARLLVQAIGNEQLSFSLRIDCAKDVLNRIYGKQAPPEQPGSVRFVLEEELERYAK